MTTISKSIPCWPQTLANDCLMDAPGFRQGTMTENWGFAGIALRNSIVSDAAVSMPILSVIIVAWRSREEIIPCVRSIPLRLAQGAEDRSGK